MGFFAFFKTVFDVLGWRTDYLPTGGEAIGTRYWDPENLTTTLVLPNGGLLQDGQEVYVLATNLTGADVTDGVAVAITSASGNRVAFTLADPADPAIACAYIGLTTEPITKNTKGRVTIVGEVHNLNTNAYNEGDQVYVNPAAPGALTKTVPTPPNTKIVVGIVSVKHASEGVITLARRIIPRLNSLSDVDAISLTASGQVLTYNASTGVFAANNLTLAHNGTAATLATNTAAPSDLQISCGTDKTVVLTETVYDDLPPIPIITQRVGANAPTLTLFTGNIYQFTFDATNDEVFGAYELIHAYKEGTNLSVHVHWATNGVDIANRYVKWECEYTVSNADAVIPFSAAFPAAVVLSQETMIPANTPTLSHTITSLGTITGTGLKIGAYLIFRFRRVAATGGDAPSSNPFALALGVHHEIDTMGSRQLYIK